MKAGADAASTRRAAWHQGVRFALTLLVSAGVVAAAILFGDVERYREAIGSLQIVPLMGLTGLLVTCNLLRVLRLKILLPEVSPLPLARMAFVHQFLAGMFPAKLGELTLPVMLARTGTVSATGAVGVLLCVRLLDVGALLIVASVALVVVGGSIDARVPMYALGALVMLLLSAGAVLYVFKAIYTRPTRGRRFTMLVHAIVMPLARLTILDSLRVAVVTLAVWALLLVAFYIGGVSFQLAATFGEVVVSAAAANLMAALPVNGIGGVGLTQLSWAGLLSAFGREFETALVVGVAVQAVALAVAGAGAVVLSGWLFVIRRNKGDVGC